MAGNFFRGTSLGQDSRFGDKHEKLLKQLKFPPEYDLKVDMKKVKLDIIKPWIAKRISEFLGMDDEVVVGLCFNLLEEKGELDPRNVQITMTGFLERNAKKFVAELWGMLHSASQNASGIPTAMLEKKKQELIAKKMDRERIEESVRRKGDELQRDNQGSERERDNRNKKSMDRVHEAVAKVTATLKQEGDGDEDKKRHRRWDRDDRGGRDRKQRSRSRSRDRDRDRRPKSRSRSRDRDRRGRRSRRSPSPNSSDDDKDKETELRRKALSSVKGKK